MIAKIEIQKRLDDVSIKINDLDTYNSAINSARVDILNWVISLFDVNTDNDLANKITRIEEEMIPLSNTDIMYKEKEARIEELKFCLGNPIFSL